MKPRWFWFALAVLNFVLWVISGQDNLTLVVGFWGSVIMAKLDDR